MDPALALEVAALSHQKAMNAAMSHGDSKVQRFYDNSVVFVTGGSGFLGKQLIEKLLRSCELSKVFTLLRPKKEKPVQERLDEMLKDPSQNDSETAQEKETPSDSTSASEIRPLEKTIQVFEILRKEKPNFSNKIIAIEGDVAEIRLGIKDEDWKTLTEEVDVIFHVAATTKLNEILRLATLINVRGTREALLFGKACKKLRSYIHVSTAYSHATDSLIGKEVTEEFHSSPIPPETMISMAENMDPDRLMNITTDLIKNWPNIYTFTKAISEELVRTTSADLPICIVRPGVVLCTYREPSPGWLDISCVYGATGVILGPALGAVVPIHINFNKKLGFIPCDYVNNAIIVAGWETATTQAKGGNDTRIYAVSSVYRNPATWGKVGSMVDTARRKNPSSQAVFYGYEISTSSKLLYTGFRLFYHVIPAHIADFVCVLMGKQRRFVKISNKVSVLCDTLSHFSLNEWHFVDNNLNKLYSSLSKQDKVLFNFDVANINWKEYASCLSLGIRKYIIKDGLKDTEYAIKKQRCLKIAHYFIMTLYIFGMWKLIYLVFYIVNILFSVSRTNKMKTI